MKNDTIKIFIASSGRAKSLTQKLKDAIIARVSAINSEPGKKPMSVTPILWWQAFPSGKYTLEALIDQCETCDFAAVLLTEDDVTLKNSVEPPMVKPRDNCVFEAGLFTGALGLETERTFLLTSVQKPLDVLPSDLAGLGHTQIREPGDDVGEGDVDMDIDLAAMKIVAQIKEMGPYERGVVPYVEGGDVMNKERPETESGRLVPFSRIVVQNKQPLEVLDPGFAKRVQKNINNEIRYRYFFHADPGSTSMIASLIWTLGSSGIVGTVPEKNKKIKEEPDVVLKNLDGIYNHLTIQFLPEPPTFELCVHNSESDDRAICYVRVPETQDPIQFIEWCRGAAAVKVAKSFLDLRKDPPSQSIFRSTINFDLEQRKDYVKKLCSEILGRFPDKIRPELSKVCFPENCLLGN